MDLKATPLRFTLGKQSSLTPERERQELVGEGQEDDPEEIDPGVNLIYLANEGDLDGIKELLDSGLDVNFRDIDGRTALHVAACQGLTDVVSLLLDRGADVDHEDRWGSTPLADAIYYNNHDVIKLLEKHQIYKQSHTFLAPPAQPNSEEWIFLVTSLCMEILSAACDQASSPSRPRYALFGMLLAIAALLTCICELIYKGRENNVVWSKRGCYMLFGSVIELFGLVGGITQCVCSIIQYVYYIRRANNPIKLSLLPAIFLTCLIATRLSRKRMQTRDETGEHTSYTKTDQ